MADEFLDFLRGLIATHEVKRDKKYHGVSKAFADQQRAIAAACVGALQSVEAKHMELTAPLYADDSQRRRVSARAIAFAARPVSEITVKRGEAEARLIVRRLEARGVAAVAEQRGEKWIVRKKGGSE